MVVIYIILLVIINIGLFWCAQIWHWDSASSIYVYHIKSKSMPTTSWDNIKPRKQGYNEKMKTLKTKILITWHFLIHKDNLVQDNADIKVDRNWRTLKGTTGRCINQQSTQANKHAGCQRRVLSLMQTYLTVVPVGHELFAVAISVSI